MSGSAAELYQQDFVRWTEQQSTALRDVARYSFGYGETLKELPLPGYTHEQVLGDWFPGALPPPAPSPARGGGSGSGRTRSIPGAS
jgi:hypothetical protein